MKNGEAEAVIKVLLFWKKVIKSKQKDYLKLIKIFINGFQTD